MKIEWNFSICRSPPRFFLFQIEIHKCHIHKYIQRWTCNDCCGATLCGVPKTLIEIEVNLVEFSFTLSLSHSLSNELFCARTLCDVHSLIEFHNFIANGNCVRQTDTNVVRAVSWRPGDHTNNSSCRLDFYEFGRCVQTVHVYAFDASAMKFATATSYKQSQVRVWKKMQFPRTGGGWYVQNKFTTSIKMKLNFIIFTMAIWHSVAMRVCVAHVLEIQCQFVTIHNSKCFDFYFRRRPRHQNFLIGKWLFVRCARLNLFCRSNRKSIKAFSIVFHKQKTTGVSDWRSRGHTRHTHPKITFLRAKFSETWLGYAWTNKWFSSPIFGAKENRSLICWDDECVHAQLSEDGRQCLNFGCCHLPFAMLHSSERKVSQFIDSITHHLPYNNVPLCYLS